MRRYFRPAAVGLSVAAAILVTALRILITPEMQDADTGNFHISFVLIGVILSAVVLIALLVILGAGTLPHTNNIAKHDRLPISVSGMLFGFILFVSSLFDIWKLYAFGKTPPPNDTVISNLDAITLAFTLALGLLTGIFMVYMSLRLVFSKLNTGPAFSYAALLPVIWIWVRLVRYEVSYASAIPVEQSFYDFVMLIFIMLFLFAFARYISKTGEHSSSTLLIYALCTALVALSGPLSAITFFITGETEAYNASKLAGIADLGAGVFALCTAITLVFARPLPEHEVRENPLEPLPTDEMPIGEPEEAEETQTAPEPERKESEEKIPTVEDILRELNKSAFSEEPDRNITD